MRDNSHSAEEYRDWIINAFHKYGRDEFIGFIVPYGEEGLLRSELQSTMRIANDTPENKIF